MAMRLARCAGTLVVALAVVAGGMGRAQEGEMAPNGGMEGEYVEGLAPGWVANCYGSFEVAFSKETEAVHGGRAAQKIECTRFGEGGIQIRCGGIRVAKGETYTLQAWLRGEGIRGPVLLCIRQHPSPYTKYLAQYVRVSEEWRRFTVIGESAGSDEDCGIYVWYGSTGRLWIDDVSLRAGVHKPQEPSVTAAPVKGNRVYNSGFEAGASGWRGGEIREGGHGSAHAMGLAGGQSVEGQPFTVTAGQLHTVSLYARGEGGAEGVKVRVEIVESADAGGDQPVARHHETAEFALTGQWQRYHVGAVLEAPFTAGYMLRLSAQGAALVDDVQVEEGGLTAYQPRAPVEVGLELPVLERYPEPGEQVAPKVVLAAPGRVGEEMRVRLGWQDFFGRGRPAGEGVLRVGADGRGEGRVACRGQEVGIYRLMASVETKCSPGEVVIGVLPRDDGRRVPGSFFGTHAHMDWRGENVGVGLARRAGMRWYRLHDFNHHTQWIHCEPEKKGEFVWADEEIEDLHRRGFELVGTLVRTPKWAGREYPEEKPAILQARVPRELAWYADYVRVVVPRYKALIRHWELWNEPYGWGFWAGTPEEYVELERLGYEAAREANPECRVLGLCVYPGAKDWIGAAVAAGGLDHLDVLSYHVYISPGMTEPDAGSGRSYLEEQVRYLRGLLREKGRGEVPIWNSEGGIGCPSFYSWAPTDGQRYGWDEAAAAVPKAVVEMMGAGVEKWFYYFIGYAAGSWDGYYRMNNIAYVETDVDGSPKPTLLAHAAAARLLDESVFVDRVVGEGAVAYVFERGGEATAVAWARPREEEGAETRVVAEGLRGCEVYDVMGRRAAKGSVEEEVTLTGMPVYLVGKMTGARMRGLMREGLGARGR